MSALRLIVGLGNPGAEYALHRHNAGYWLVDALAQAEGARFTREAKLHGAMARITLAGHDLRLFKPLTFMNESGRAVAAALNFWKIDPTECLVVHDDLDLPPGVARLKFDGGHGGQNGLRDIIGQLGHGRFHRLRIGIGHPGLRDQVTPWVLGRPTREQQDAMLDAIARALQALPLALDGRMQDAMQRLHGGEREPAARDD